MEAFIGVLVAVGLIVLFVYMWNSGRNAVATTVVHSPHDPRRTVEIVSRAFGGARGLLWTDSPGPGKINKRRRGKDRGIVMSIDIEPLPNGGSNVAMWASQTNVYWGFLVNFSGDVNSRKKAIARLVSA